MVNDGEVESCPKRTRHLLADHYGLVGRALFPYLPRLGVQVGQCLVGFQPRWFLGEPVSTCFPVVNGLHVHAFQPSVWPAPIS